MEQLRHFRKGIKNDSNQTAIYLSWFGLAVIPGTIGCIDLIGTEVGLSIMVTASIIAILALLWSGLSKLISSKKKAFMARQ
jgi:hypothetical protein